MTPEIFCSCIILCLLHINFVISLKDFLMKPKTVATVMGKNAGIYAIVGCMYS